MSALLICAVAVFVGVFVFGIVVLADLIKLILILINKRTQKVPPLTSPI